MTIPDGWLPQFSGRVQFPLSVLPEQQPGAESLLTAGALCHRSFILFKKRQGILEGVCVTGGEPALSPDLPEFLAEIRALGYPVKLDTNGTRPDLLKELAGEGLIQMAAVDIKACPDNYPSLCGLLHPDLDAIKETVDFLINGTLDYEFRTTVVKELHSEQDFVAIGKWLSGAKAYYLQAYRDSEEVLQPGFSSFSYKDLEHFRQILMQTIPLVELRGID